jgi:serine O-acetyltransferase
MFDILSYEYRRYKVNGSPFKNRGFYVNIIFRFGQWIFGLPKPLQWILSKFYGLLKIFCEGFCGVELDRTTKVGRGLFIIHAHDIVIHPGSVIGEDLGIMNGVTIGTAGGDDAPRIGNRVFIGTGAKILGGITVGDGAMIGANAVVLKDVPPGHVAIGVPARNLPPKEKREQESGGRK